MKPATLAWVGVVLVAGAGITTWAVKPVQEHLCSTCHDEVGRYGLDGIRLQWRQLHDGYWVERVEYLPYGLEEDDHNLPWDLADRLAIAWPFGVAAMAAGALARTALPHVGTRILLITVVLHAVLAVLLVATYAAHAYGWGAKSVGTFRPWTGTALTLAGLALAGIASRPLEEATILPSLPPRQAL